MKAKRPTPPKPTKSARKSPARPPRKVSAANYRGDAVKLIMEHFPQQSHSQGELIRCLPSVVAKRDLIGIQSILQGASGSFSAGELLTALFDKK